VSYKRSWAVVLLAAAVVALAAAQDRGDPSEVARTALVAYQQRDLHALARLASAYNRPLIAEIARDGQAHPRYHSLFGEDSWRWQGVRDWDGRILDVRYRGPSNRPVAQVKFGTLGEREALVVTLEWRDNGWWFEDVNSPVESAYQEFRREP
jgi:hypothetical protein